MKKHLILLLVLFSYQGHADLFGGDVAVLTQILVQTVQQLTRLKEIVGVGRDQIDLVRQINQGINDSLYFLRRVNPNFDPGTYRDWETVSDGLRHIEDIYGAIPLSKEAPSQKNTDQLIAEAVTSNNANYKYSAELDGIGEQIQSASHKVSPGGAQKLTAQAMGLLIQATNQNLRVQSTLLKLQAHELALKNKKDKNDTRSFLDISKSLSGALRRETVTFKTPRF